SLLPKETLVSKTSAYQSVIQRPSFWGLVAAGLLLAAAAVITVLNRFVYSAESAVEDYVEALGNGDGATAIALSQAYLADDAPADISTIDRKSTRLNSSHVSISYAVFCLKKKKKKHIPARE